MRYATLVENAMLQGNISMVQAENLLRDVLQLQALSKPWQWPNWLPPLPVCFETFTLNSVEERQEPTHKRGGAGRRQSLGVPAFPASH